MGMMKIPSNKKTFATVAIIKPPIPTQKVFLALPLQIERNLLLKGAKGCQSQIAICKRLRWIFSEL